MLIGCEHLNKSIEQRLEVSEQCRLATAELPERWNSYAPIASIQLGNVGYCDIGQSETLLPICTLKSIEKEHGYVLSGAHEQARQTLEKRYVASATDEKSIVSLDSAAEKRTGNVAEYDSAVRDLVVALRALQAEMENFDRKYWTFLRRFSRANYADRTALTMMSRDEAVRINGMILATRLAQAELRRVIVAMGSDLVTQARVELLAWDSNLHAQLAQLERLLSGDVSLVLRDGLRNQVLTHVAQRSLELLHGALKAPTAVINRLDKEAYGAVSVGYLLFGPDIQTAVNGAFVDIKASYERRLSQIPEARHNSAGIGPFLVELRRAACDRLLSGTEFSLLSELVDTMLILQIERTPHKRRSPVKAGTVWPYRATEDSPLNGARMVTTAYGDRAPPEPEAEPVPAVSPLSVYAANEWMARQQLLEEAIGKKLHGEPDVPNGARPLALAIQTVDENAVRRLADSATAKAVDDATRQYPALLDNPAGMSARLAANVNVSTAASAVSLASVVLDVNVSVTNTNTFNPTNYNNVNPVIHLPTAASPLPAVPSLCTADGLLAAGAVCVRDGDVDVITLSERFFDSDSCQVADLGSALSGIGELLSKQGRQYGVQYDATVLGFASQPRATLKHCAMAKREDTHMCRYRNRVHTTFDVQGCRAGDADRNMLLSAARARNAAQAIEQASNGAIVVRQIVARGAQGVYPTQDKAAQAADQTVVLRLRRHGTAAQVD